MNYFSRVLVILSPCFVSFLFIFFTYSQHAASLFMCLSSAPQTPFILCLILSQPAVIQSPWDLHQCQAAVHGWLLECEGEFTLSPNILIAASWFTVLEVGSVKSVFMNVERHWFYFHSYSTATCLQALFCKAR